MKAFDIMEARRLKFCRYLCGGDPNPLSQLRYWPQRHSIKRGLRKAARKIPRL